VTEQEQDEGLPTVATYTLSTDYSQGIIWHRNNETDLSEGDELVRREDVEQLIKDQVKKLREKRNSIPNEKLKDSEEASHKFYALSNKIKELEELLERVQNNGD